MFTLRELRISLVYEYLKKQTADMIIFMSGSEQILTDKMKTRTDTNVETFIPQLLKNGLAYERDVKSDCTLRIKRSHYYRH
jgi:hypothetical protein